MLRQEQGKVTSNLEPDKYTQIKITLVKLGKLLVMMMVHPKKSCTQHDIIKIDPSDITEKNNACAWG